MKTHYLARFKKSYAKRIANDKTLKKRFEERYFLFTNNPRNPTLKDHELKGAMTGLRSFSITGDIRVIYFIEDETAFFFDIGTHNQVY